MGSYSNTFVGDTAVTFCLDCGAVVIEPDTHNRFHEALAAQRRS